MKVIADVDGASRGWRSRKPARLVRSAPILDCKVGCLSDAVELLAPMFAEQAIEQFRALLLGKNGEVLGMVTASGTHYGVEFPIRSIFARALGCDAWGLVIAHNHPSGDPSPSRAEPTFPLPGTSRRWPPVSASQCWITSFSRVGVSTASGTTDCYSTVFGSVFVYGDEAKWSSSSGLI